MDGSVVFARWRQCAPPRNTCFLGPTRVQMPNDILIGSAIFAQLTTESRYTLQRLPLPLPLKLLLHTEISTPVQYMVPFRWAHPSQQSKRHLDRFNRFFAGLTTVTDRQTDRPRYSICITVGRIYVRSRRCGPIIMIMTTGLQVLTSAVFFDVYGSLSFPSSTDRSL